LEVECPKGHIFEFDPRDGIVETARGKENDVPPGTYNVYCPECGTILDVEYP